MNLKECILLIISCICIQINGQVPVPSGIQLPSALLGQVIPTANPYLPNRPENMPPSPTPSSAIASKDAAYFVLKDFLIVLGGVLGFIMLIVMILMGWRFIKGDPDLTKQWETETEKLAQRTAVGAAKSKKVWKLKKKTAKKGNDLKLEFQSE